MLAVVEVWSGIHRARQVQEELVAVEQARLLLQAQVLTELHTQEVEQVALLKLLLLAVPVL